MRRIDARVDALAKTALGWSVNIEGAAHYGTLDSLNYLVHGDAIDMEVTSSFSFRKKDVRYLYSKPLVYHWFPRGTVA